jgi:bla regulator protein BlaR1
MPGISFQINRSGVILLSVWRDGRWNDILIEEGRIIIYTALAVWITGVLWIILKQLYIYLKIRAAIKNAGGTQITSSNGGIRYESLFEGADPDIVLTDNVPYIYCPCVFGAIRQKILIPRFQWKAMSGIQRRAVIAHELSHIKHKDNFTNFILLFILAVFWWNPVIRISLRAFKHDLELLRDSRVIRYLKDSERAAYAEALLNLSMIASRHYVIAPHSGALCSSGVGLRIRLIRDFQRRSLLLSILISVIYLALLFLTFHIGILGFFGFSEFTVV